jgi:DNA-binding beta-propeller fold protein YncE
MRRRTPAIAVGLCLSSLLALSCTHAPADASRTTTGETAADAPKAERIATGQLISPTAVPNAVQVFLNPGLPAYPGFVAGDAVKSALSPDGKTLAILCAGQNSLNDATGQLDVASSTQFVFLYDVSGAHQSAPGLVQVLQQTNAHVGMAFGPDGTLYVSGGKDDAVYVYAPGGGRWALARKIPLGHSGKGLGIEVEPNASGLAVSADGATVVVANNYNDSISVLDTATGRVRYEHDLRPYFAGNEGTKAGVGGSYPFAVLLAGTVAYVSSARDRQVIAVDVSNPGRGKLVARLPLDGNPLGMAFDAGSSRLFVAQDNADQVAVIDTRTNAVVQKIDARGPPGLFVRADGAKRHTGAGTFAVTLSPDRRTLYAVNSASNSIAVIPLQGERAFQVFGLIPTAYEPHDVTLSKDGTWMYVVNGKSVTGPNPKARYSQTARVTWSSTLGGKAASATAKSANQYQFQLERASLVAAPVPRPEELAPLTRAVAANNFYDAERAEDRKVMEQLRQRIKHVIYIVKENRTYDQILGDLGNGSNGDPSLTQFPEPFTPNFHRLARGFVTLDNFTDPGDGSMDGWSWSLQGRVTNTETITQQIAYGFVNRGLSFESTGENRNVPVNFPTVAERDAAVGPAGTTEYTSATAALPGGTENLLTGTGNHASTDAPSGKQEGYIFEAVLRAGGTVRNYGFLVENVGPLCTGGKSPPCPGAEITDPHRAGVVQVAPLTPSLIPVTDLYFRGYDQDYPDLWRYQEWKREFDQFVATGNLPSLTLLRLARDHTGAFGTAQVSVNTPETQLADNDLAVGLVVQAVANSPYAKDTILIVLEDDCQDGPDHVDSHRASAWIVGAHVKQGAVVSQQYSQVNALRTIEDILGTEHLNLNTAYQRPMVEVFDLQASGWTYEAVASTVLKRTSLRLPAGVSWAAGPDVRPKHDAAYWARATRGFDFSDADRVPPLRFNQVLWRGLMGNRPYPEPAGPRREDDDD